MAGGPVGAARQSSVSWPFHSPQCLLPATSEIQAHLTACCKGSTARHGFWGPGSVEAVAPSGGWPGNRVASMPGERCLDHLAGPQGTSLIISGSSLAVQ